MAEPSSPPALDVEEPVVKPDLALDRVAGTDPVMVPFTRRALGPSRFRLRVIRAPDFGDLAEESFHAGAFECRHSAAALPPGGEPEYFFGGFPKIVRFNVEDPERDLPVPIDASSDVHGSSCSTGPRGNLRSQVDGAQDGHTRPRGLSGL